MNLFGEITGRYFLTGQLIRLGWRDGVITMLEEAAQREGEPLWIAPLLFDPQINGYGGVDFQRDNLTADELQSAAAQLREAACGKFFFTLITAEWERLLARFRRAKGLRAGSKSLQSAIAGWHIEGPFLSEQPGFHGAHDPQFMLDPTPEKIRELREIAGDDPLLLTLAPERPGALEAIQIAVSLGMKVSLGHTNASAEILAKAVAAGATGFTHLGNGCPRELDRGDNILWRVLERPELTVGLIPDKIHVSPPLFRLFHRMINPANSFYTTDAMSAAGAPPGRYSLGETVVEVGADQVACEPNKTHFAGSALRPVEGVFRAAEMLGGRWQNAWACASQAPAKFMGLTNELKVGASAEFCLLRVNDQNELSEFKIIPGDPEPE